MNKISQILSNIRNIAVIGIKNGATDDAFKVPYYMKLQGYNIFPVNPKLAGEILFDKKVVSKITDLAAPVDLVDIFRNPKHLYLHAQEILQMKPLPEYVWFQLGIYNDDAAKMLEDKGIIVVQNRCIMVEHANTL